MPGRTYLRGIPAVAHQRLSPASQPAYSSPLMPYLLMDEDDIVVLPRRRHFGRVHEELDDDPVLQQGASCPNCCSNCGSMKTPPRPPPPRVTYVIRMPPQLPTVPSIRGNSPYISGEDELHSWYEDRIHHAQAEAIFNANKRVADLCTPRARHLSAPPPYIQGKYKEPLPAEYHKYRAPITEALKPVRSNIETRSHFHSAAGPAENRYNRMGKRPRSRFYRGDQRLTEMDMAEGLVHLPNEDEGTRKLHLVPIASVPGTFRLIATGERPKRRPTLEVLDLRRRALLLDKDEDLADGESPEHPERDGSSSAEHIYDDDDDNYDYDCSPERDYERDYTPLSEEYEDAEDRCPELEARGSAGMSKYRDEYDAASLTPEPVEERDVEELEETAYREEDELRELEEIQEFSNEEMEEERYERDLALDAHSEPDLIPADPEEDMQNISPEVAAAEDEELDPPADGDMDESGLVRDASPANHNYITEESNMVDQMVITTAVDDEQRSDATDNSRAKLTQMKSEAAQRLDDLEKLIDEHQEIVEELKRTESSQGSLVDLACASPVPSPESFPAESRPADAASAEELPPLQTTDDADGDAEERAAEIASYGECVSEDAGDDAAEEHLAELEPVDDYGETTSIPTE